MVNKETMTIQKEIEEMVNQNFGLVTLVKGYLENDKPYYAYIKILTSNYIEFKQALAKGDIDISQYGEIITSGEGLEPPQEVKQEMKDKYNCEEGFEEKAIRVFEEVYK